MNAREIAEMIGVHPNTIYNMIRNGELSAEKIGKSFNVSHEEVTELKNRKEHIENSREKTRASYLMVFKFESELEVISGILLEEIKSAVEIANSQRISAVSMLEQGKFERLIKLANLIEDKRTVIRDLKSLVKNSKVDEDKEIKNDQSYDKQKKWNDKNTRKRLAELLDANFTKNDICVTLSYAKEQTPNDKQQAKKDMQNYMRRAKRYMRREGIGELKYVYVTEFKENAVIHHAIMNLRDRDIAESFWQSGSVNAQARRLQDDDFGFNGLVKYLPDNEYNEKRYNISRNMEG